MRESAGLDCRIPRNADVRPVAVEHRPDIEQSRTTGD